jgi:acetyl-CoA acetyltransferase
MVAVVMIVLVAVALTFGQTRYRSSAEVVLVVLAGVAIDDLLSRHRRLDGVRVPAEVVIGEQGGNVAAENVSASHR